MRHLQLITRVTAFMLLAISAMPIQTFARDFGHSSDATIEIISDERGVLSKYAAGSGSHIARRSYVIARDEERYRIRVRNRNNERIGVLIAVDGRNIISGRKSHLKPSEKMYILGPYQTGEYEGWRTSKNRVNRFYFTGMSNSYAAAWGDYSATGVIAIAIYKSRHKDVYGYKRKGHKTDPFQQPKTNRRRENPGTGFGESERSPSRTVHFSPQKKPAVKEFIKYEWKTTLCRIGVVSCRIRKERHSGNRFWPGHPRDQGYAPFPPLWPFR